MSIEQLPHEEAYAGDRIQVPIAGGVLVYEHCTIGKDLIGFVDVENWDALADGLAARGHSRGAVYHLPELDR
ncbi:MULTISPECIES: hypothetical protein [Salinibaculum]|uniref:hypothetical protein n=1 Tax=Salinibaculum TaxID=2732368 RepID=UPI0030CB30DA